MGLLTTLYKAVLNILKSGQSSGSYSAVTFLYIVSHNMLNTRSLKLSRLDLWMKSLSVTIQMTATKCCSSLCLMSLPDKNLNKLLVFSDHSQFYSSYFFCFVFRVWCFFFCVLLPRSGFAPMLVSVK